MAPTRGTTAKLLIDEFDFSGETNGIKINISRAVLDPTNLESTAMEKIAGLADGSIEHNGFHTGAGAGEIEPELRARFGVAGTAYVGVTMGSAGDPAFVLPTTWLSQLKTDVPTADLITLSGTWPAAANLRPGLMVYRGTPSSTGALTSIDFTNAGSAGGVAYLFIQDVTGTATNAQVKVQSATTEGGSYSDEGTFEFDGVGVQVLALSGTVNRWVRANVVDLGGATDFTIVCIAGLSGVSY